MSVQIGLSLSFCISDILKGEVSEQDVGKIIASTRAVDEAGWEALLCCYKQSYWSFAPDKAEELVRKLRSEGRIEQPRLLNEGHYPRIWKGHWVSLEEEIQWADSPEDEG